MGKGLNSRNSGSSRVAAMPMFALVMAGLMLAPATAAFAGEAQGNSDASVDSGDIVVTATKRSESSMSVPVALSAFSGATLANTGIRDVQAVQMATPALVFPNTGAYAQPYIRGVGSRLLQNGFDPSVAVYVDGRYISRQSAIVLDLFDVQRVEVLKGPQGTLFGRNASGGAMRIITNEVSDQAEGMFKAGYGNYNALTASAMANMPLSNDLGIRISGMTSQRDGYAKNIISTGSQKWDDKNLNSVRGKLRWTPGILDANLTLSYWKQHDNSGNETVSVGALALNTGIANGGTTGVGVDQVATKVKGVNDKREFAGELSLKFDLGSVSLQSISNFADLDNHLTFDGDGTSAVLVDAVVYEKSKTYSQELQLSSTSDGPFEWIVGAYYFYDKTSQETTIDQGAKFISQGLQTVRTESYAGFGQVGWNFTDALKLEIGGRYTHDQKKVGIVPTKIPGLVAAVNVTLNDERSWSKFTPSATLTYKFADSMVYAKFSRGFKSGGFNYPVAGAPVVSPEQLDMYEIGLKSELLNRTMQFTMSGYYYDYKNLQVSRAAAAGTAIVTTQNAANAQLYGIDADLNWKLADRLKLSTGLAWQHSEYRNYTNASAKEYKGVLAGDTTPGMVDYGFDASGERLLRAPAFSAYASLNYELPVGAGKVPINLSYSYKGSYLFDFIVAPLQTGTTTIVDPKTQVLRQKAYHLVNARIGYTPDNGSWDVSFWANNLFNERYFDDVVGAGVGLRGSYGAPRTYGGEVTFRF